VINSGADLGRGGWVWIVWLATPLLEKQNIKTKIITFKKVVSNMAEIKAYSLDRNLIVISTLWHCWCFW